MIPLSVTETVVFLLLLVIWAGVLFTGFAYGFVLQPTITRVQVRLPHWARVSSSLVLTLLAWLWFVSTLGTRANALSIWFALGITTMFCGDLLMRVDQADGQQNPNGFLAFAFGHLAFITGMFFSARANGLSPIPWGMLSPFYVLVVFVWWRVVYRRSKRAGHIRFALLAYSLLVATTLTFALGLAVQNSAYLLVSIGSVLIAISDYLMTAHHFTHLQTRYLAVGDIIWLMYGPGQMMLVAGVMLLDFTQGL